MSQLMRQQALTALRPQIVLSPRKHHVAPEREGACLNAGRRPVGLWPIVDAHVAKVMAEARLEVGAAGCIEWRPGTQAAGEVRSDLAGATLAIRLALNLRLLPVARAVDGCV